MAGVTYFVQECPTCGRRLQVRVEYLGKRIACKNCDARFIASDDPCDTSSATWALMARADELIEAAASVSGIHGASDIR